LAIPPTNGQQQQPVVIVDCRPFMAYNASHIHGAINVNCSDRWNRKRLQTGRVSLADLATSPEGKELLRRRSVKEVIVYDDGAVDCERLPPSSTLYIVLSALLDDHKEPLLLAGNLTLSYFIFLELFLPTEIPKFLAGSNGLFPEQSLG
jgi:dual specificity MAP kinase phosphatase